LKSFKTIKFNDSLAESDQKTLKVGIHSFPAWRSAFKQRGAGKFACCVFGQGT